MRLVPLRGLSADCSANGNSSPGAPVERLMTTPSPEDHFDDEQIHQGET